MENVLKVGTEHLARFDDIRRRFIDKTVTPKEANWRSLTENDIWLYIFEQVIAVGSSKPSTKFHENVDLRNWVSMQALGELKDDQQLMKRVNQVLRMVGARYASSDISKCRKTQALVYNFIKLKEMPGGPRGFLEEISKMQYSDVDRTRDLMKRFKFIKSKNARDLLMEMGIVRNTIAMDVRIRNIFKKIGLELPNGFESNPKLYEEIERDILNKICKPLDISGVELDRMLYHNYDEIMKTNF